MRTGRILALVAVGLVSFACTGESVRRVRIDMPGYAPFRVSDFDRVIVTNFKAENDTGDFNVAGELADYLAEELGRRLGGKVSRTSVPTDKAGRAGDTEFWKSLPAGPGSALFLTGTISYREEVRKALLEKDPSVIDGPFRGERKPLSERRIYTMPVRIALVRAGSGEVVLDKEFKETRTFSDTNQLYSYAYYEIVPHLRNKLFRLFFGDTAIEERTLIVK
jgi:hypothetical protein